MSWAASYVTSLFLSILHTILLLSLRSASSRCSVSTKLLCSSLASNVHRRRIFAEESDNVISLNISLRLVLDSWFSFSSISRFKSSSLTWNLFRISIALPEFSRNNPRNRCPGSIKFDLKRSASSLLYMSMWDTLGENWLFIFSSSLLLQMFRINSISKLAFL